MCQGASQQLKNEKNDACSLPTALNILILDVKHLQQWLPDTLVQAASLCAYICSELCKKIIEARVHIETVRLACVHHSFVHGCCVAIFPHGLCFTHMILNLTSACTHMSVHAE